MIKRLFIVIITPIFFLLAAHFIIPYLGVNKNSGVFMHYVIALLVILTVLTAGFILYNLINWIVNGK
jgi:hypothetical protein